MQQRVTIRIDQDIADALDAFVCEQTFAFKSRQDAYRFIIRDWLIARRYLAASDPVRPASGAGKNTGGPDHKVLSV